MATNPDIETDIPREVYSFFYSLNRAVEDQKPGVLNELYEDAFEDLTKKFYVVAPGQSRPWPSLRLQQVQEYFKNKTAELLYSFLFYKHLFTDRAVTAGDAQVAWSTFRDLFATLSSARCSLPSWMLWDIFDEFIYQMTVVYQKRFSGRVEWAVPEAFRLLDAIIEQSAIVEKLQQPGQADDLTKDGNTPALSGFFAIISKAKLNVLLGDYYGALETLQPLDIFRNGRSVLQKVPPANISLLYYVGFSYLMIHRFEDAGNNFRKCLSVKVMSRRFSERVQLDAAYMFVCARVLGGMMVSHVSSFLDSRKVAAFEDDKESLRTGDEERFREVFDRCSPKFLAVPPLSTSAKGTEGRELQARMFRRAVQQQQEIIKLRGYFGVYQNTKMSLLETLLDTNDGYAPLFALKMRSRQLVHDGEDANLLSGEFKVSSQFDCIVSDDNVEVVPSTNFSSTELKYFNKIKSLQRDLKQIEHKQQRRQQNEAQQQRRTHQQNQRGQNAQPRNANRAHRPAGRPVPSNTGNLFNRNEN